jgi:hypothetical protein
MQIRIEIQNKIAKRIDPKEFIVCGNSDYTLKFTFDEEWAEYEVKTARFYSNGEPEDVVFKGDECPVPVMERADGVFIGVFAGDLKTTTKAYIPCERCILCLGGRVKEPTPDVYAQLMKMINDGMLKGEPFKYEDFTEEQLAELSPQKGVDYWTESDKKDITEYIDKEIAEFDFVKVIDSKPEVGLPNREYFIRKTSDDTNDLFEEWAWINKGTEESPNWGWEFKGTKKFEIDLTDYTKKTDFGMGFYVDDEGYVRLTSNTGALESRVDFPILGSTMDWAWKQVATNNQVDWEDYEWEAFYTFIGAVKDYHTNRNGIARFNDGKLDVTDGLVNSSSPHAVNGRVLYKQIEAVKTAITNNYSVRYFDLGDNRDTAFSSLKLGANSMFIITENESYQASAKGSADTGGAITDNYDLLPHDKTSTIGKYYDVATTIFIISNGENSPYTNRDDMRSVIRMTLDGLSTSLKFFWVKEQADGTVLTLSMKSTGQHRECVLLGNKKIG